MNIIGIGDNVVDCYYSDGVYYPGGNAVNVAVRCKRDGCEHVGYIGIFANDEKGDHIKACLTKEGVIWSKRSRTMIGVSGSPGVRLNEQGDRVFVPGPKETVQRNCALRLIPVDFDFIRDFDICHTSVYSNIEPELPALHGTLPISFDFSDHHEYAYIQRVAPFVDYAFFSCSGMDPAQITGIVNECHDYGVKVVGCTMGSNGALFSDGKQQYTQGIVPVKVIDTMGAGDAFIAAFLTRYFEACDMKESLRYAAEQAAEACQCHGGWGYPHPLEI